MDLAPLSMDLCSVSWSALNSHYACTSHEAGEDDAPQEHRIESIAIKAGKAHSPFIDTVLPYAFPHRYGHWARGCHFGVVTWSIPKRGIIGSR